MKIVADLHTHTICCGHGYSTLKEMVCGAKLNGIKILATTDHGPGMPGAAQLNYFEGLVRLSQYIDGVRVLKGVEANICSPDGELDVPSKLLSKMDLVLVGFHPMCGYDGKTEEENTKALLKAISNPLVDIIVHPGNPMFPINIEKVVKAAVENDVIVEINNSSFCGSRRGSKENCLAIARECLKIGAIVSLDTDAHISFDVGRVDLAVELVKQAGIKEDQVINVCEKRVMDFVTNKRKLKNKFLDI